MAAQDLCIFALRIRVVGHTEFLVSLLNNFNILTQRGAMKVNYTLVITLLKYGPRSNSFRLYPLLSFSPEVHWPQMQTRILETLTLKLSSDVDKTSESIRARPRL